MKKLGIMTAILLMFSSLFPQSLFAEENTRTVEEGNESVEVLEQGIEEEIEGIEVEGETLEESGVKENEIENPKVNQDEYNEFGIKKGTMIYGEDISELSEWELQYIPEGWRDGIIESEHSEEATPRLSIMGTKQNYPNVNNYIRSKKFTAARVQYDHKNFFTKFNYRNGFGQVEGVVVHETANSRSNIAGEITYMSRNHKNAFVHAFIDHSQIIEIHPPELGAWGAGRIANQRFIHLELVRVHSFDHFARSINNYADYIANLLYKYNLGVSDADNNGGQGTLWSHRGVSRILGATNSPDPHAYFESWGYNWNEFVKLIRSKHSALVANKRQYTSKLGHIRSAATPIYDDPMNLAKYTVAGSDFTNEVYYIKQEALVNGKRYYLLSRQPSNRSGTIGWIDAAGVNVHEHVGVGRSSESFVIRGTGKAFNKAWGGSKNLVYDDLSQYIGSTFRVNLIENVGKNTWYRGILSGKQVWVHSSAISQETPTSKLGHIRSANVKIYKQLGNNSSAFQAGSEYTNKVYYIKSEAKINGQTYQMISTRASRVNGVVGWVKAGDLSTHTHVGVDKNSKTFYLKGTGSAYGTAWGGSKDLVYQNLSTYKNQEFKVHLTEKVGRNIWYRGTLNGKTVWLHSSYVGSKTEKNTSKLGHIRNSNVQIYPRLGDHSSVITAGETYTNAVYYIKKEAVVNGQVYQLISTSPSSVNNVLGWVKAGDLSTHKHVGVDRKAKKLYFKGSGSAFDTAWGGSKNHVFKDLSQYKNQVFNVNLTERVGNNIWYRGILNGKTVWVHNSYLKSN